MTTARQISLALAATVVVAACAQSPALARQSACNAGSTCELTGKLQVFRGSASIAILDTGERTYALALRDDLYPLLNSGPYIVTVRGAATEQPSFDAADGTIVLSYQLNDRWVATGVCDQCLILYVDDLRIPKLGLDVATLGGPDI